MQRSLGLLQEAHSSLDLGIKGADRLQMHQLRATVPLDLTNIIQTEAQRAGEINETETADRLSQRSLEI